MSEITVSPGRSTLFTVLKLVALALVVILCVFVIRPVLTNPSTFQDAIDYLDEKKQNATTISMGTANASFIISMIPDDAGTPVAGELAKLSSYILFVLSTIMLEKYLLTHRIYGLQMMMEKRSLQISMKVSMMTFPGV